MKKTNLMNSIVPPPVITTSTKGKDGGNKTTKSTKSGPDIPEFLPRMVNEPDVSLDEMLSLACRQGKLDIVKLLIQSGAKVNHRNKAGNTPLLEACSQGHVYVARFLLDNGGEIDAPTETTLDSPLTWACTLGNTEVVEELLKKKASVEHRTKDGCTALMFACLAGHMKVAEKLLDHGAEINVESDSNKDSPLTFACWKGHGEVVDLLLKRNANIEHRTKEGFSPLMFAALGGHKDVATKLLKQKAQVNVPSGSNNDIPLTSACWKGHHDVVKLLLANNSNIEHRTKDGCTPLMLAAREGHLQVARLLLEHGAQVNVPSGSENNIPLTLACWKGHTKVVALLLQHSSDIEHRNKAGCTPLMLSAREGHVDTTKLLLENDAQVNAPSGSNDDTPLTLACWKGHNNVVELLIKYKSNVDHQTKTGCTPLMEATREGHKRDAEILLSHGADVELPDNYGQSPLFMACWKGHHAVAELLLERNANKDCRTKTGITPLFQACRENHVSIVSLLLDFGASVNSTFPNSRENPLTLAAEKGHKELINLLLLRGANHDCHTKKGCSPLFLACKEGHKEIAALLYTSGADMEATDCRGNTPVVAAFRSGHVHVVEWLIKHTHHLPSDEICHKILMSTVDCKDNEILVQKRSKCLSLIQEAKKRRELQALKNAQSLVQEIDDEITREERKKKKQAEKRRDKRRKKKSLREMETNSSTSTGSEPLENRVHENGSESQEEKIDTEMKMDLNSPDDAIDDLDDEESKAEKLQPYENREETEHDDIFTETVEENVLKSQGKTTAGNTTVGDNNLCNHPSRVTSQANRVQNLESDDHVFEDDDNVFVSSSIDSESRKEHRLRASSSLPETELRNGFAAGCADEDHGNEAVVAQPRRRSTSSATAEDKTSGNCEKWTRPKSSGSGGRSEQLAKVANKSPNSALSAAEFSEADWKDVHRTTKTLIIQMTVPNSFCGRVIGKAGSKINSITDDSGAQITVNKPEPHAPNDRLIIVKGSPPSVERARFLVTEALNSPSIFQNQGRNSITLGGFIDQKTLPSPTQAATQTHPTAAINHTPDMPVPCAPTQKPSAVPSNSPRGIESSASCANVSSAVGYSFAPLPSHDSQSNNAVGSNRLTYSKIASGAWNSSPAGQNNLKKVPVIPTTTIASCTQSETTTVSRASYSVALDLPPDVEDNLNRALVSEVSLVTCVASSSSGSSRAPPERQSQNAKELNHSPCQKVDEDAEFSYFSPWNPKILDASAAIQNTSDATSDLQDEGPLQSFSSLVNLGMYSREIPPFPWQKADVIRQDRSRSWAGRPTQLASDLAPLNVGESDSGSSMFGNRSVSANVLSEQQTPGFKSPWGQDAGGNGREVAEDEADDPVFIDKMPWIGDGGDRVSDSVLMSNTDTWEPSSSPTSSLSSSRQELNNILDNDSGVGGSNMWTQTPTSEQGSASQPALEASPWMNARGAYSAPSSPALQRANDNPFLSPRKQNLKSHPSMEELNNKLWTKKPDSEAWDSTRTTTPPSVNGRRYSSGGVAGNNDVTATQDSGLSSPRHNKTNETTRQGRINPNDPTLAKTGVWREDRFERITSLNALLSSLSLEKYKDLLQEKHVDIDRLSNMAECELQTLGIAKGPRLKLMKAAKVVVESRICESKPQKQAEPKLQQQQQHQKPTENMIMLDKIHMGHQQPQGNGGFIHATHQFPQPQHLQQQQHQHTFHHHHHQQHPPLQIPLPPGYEHLQQQQQHHQQQQQHLPQQQQQQFNYMAPAAQSIRHHNHAIAHDNPPVHSQFQPGVDYVSHLPHSVGQILPQGHSVPQAPPPNFPFMYHQESPAFFFYQQ